MKAKTQESVLKELEKGMNKMTIQEFIKNSGMTHKQLSERFGIPKRTIEDWSRGVRKCPEYVVNMMKEILSKEKENNGNV